MYQYIYIYYIYIYIFLFLLIFIFIHIEIHVYHNLIISSLTMILATRFLLTAILLLLLSGSSMGICWWTPRYASISVYHLWAGSGSPTNVPCFLLATIGFVFPKKVVQLGLIYSIFFKCDFINMIGLLYIFCVCVWGWCLWMNGWMFMDPALLQRFRGGPHGDPKRKHLVCCSSFSPPNWKNKFVETS